MYSPTVYPLYPDEAADIRAAARQSCNLIAQSVYIAPYWQAYLLKDGRIIEIVTTTSGYGETIYVFSCYREWTYYDTRRSYRDPETNRVAWRPSWRIPKTRFDILLDVEFNKQWFDDRHDALREIVLKSFKPSGPVGPR